MESYPLFCYNTEIDMDYNVRQVNNFISEYQSDERLRSDKDVTLAVVARSPSLVAYADEKLLDDKDVALASVEKDGRTLRFFSEKVRSDEDVALAAVKNFRSSYAFVTGDAKTREKVALAVAAAGGDTVSMLDKKSSRH